MSAAAFTIAREALLPALAAAGKVVEKRSTIPVLQNVLLEAEGERLSLTVSNLDQEFSASVPLAGSTAAPIATTVNAQSLTDAVRKMPEGAEIGFGLDSAFANVSAGRSRFRLPVLPPSDYPRLSAGDYSHHFSLKASTLAHMIATTQFAISSEETRYYLNGIYWHTDGDEDRRLHAVATDGHRLAKIAVDLPEGAAGMPAIIIPRKTVGMVKSLVGDSGDVSISLSDSKILFGIGEEGKSPVMLTSKLIDGSYPDYRRVVPAGNRNHFRAARSPLLAAIDRVTTISAERGSAVKHVFGSDEGTLALLANNPDAGSAEDFVSIEQLEGDAVEIGFNGRYCLDMLAASPSENVIFELGDAGAPALIRPQGDDRTIFVLMPMRV